MKVTFRFQVILKSKLQKSEMLCRDLREEISTVKDDCLQLQGQCWAKVNTVKFKFFVKG